MSKLACADTSRQCVVYQLSEMPGLVARILSELEELGYARKERLGVRLALEEALVNAVKHGNRGDCKKPVRVKPHSPPIRSRQFLK